MRILCIIGVISLDHPTRRSEGSTVLVMSEREGNAKARSLADAAFRPPPQTHPVIRTLHPDQHHHQTMMFR